MVSSAIVVFCAAALTADPVATRWIQVAPKPTPADQFERAGDRRRAVVLIQGFRPHPFKSSNVAKAELHGWQEPNSILVRALATDADVYSFAYGQNAAVERIAEAAGFTDAISRLKKLGYSEIVLIGYSAGGLIARNFVEDHPDAGVTKVVQVCVPNCGSNWGNATIFVRHPQEEFLQSLSKAGRQQCLARRADKKIPAGVEFVCLVGHMELEADVSGTASLTEGVDVHAKVSVRKAGDGAVSSACQWTPDLQAQGIPVLITAHDHYSVVRTQAGAAAITGLVRDRQPRWTPEQVAAACKQLNIETPAPADSRP